MNLRGLFISALWYLPRGVAHKLLYRVVTHKKLDLSNPQDLNEKLQYLMVNKYGEREGKLADKNLVKKYVEGLGVRGLKIPKTIRVYDSADDISFAELPDQFVLKCNHGSGGVFVCKDKNNFNLDEAKNSLGKNLNKNFARSMLEYHYSYIKPVIMVEQYLDDKVHKNPLDYKFYCYNGKVDRVLVCSEREKKLRLDDYDLEWNWLDDTLPVFRPKERCRKPKKLEEMVRIAGELSKGIPFVRIDLYEIDGEIYFGEYTFTPAAGMITYYRQKTLDGLGLKLDLSKY